MKRSFMLPIMFPYSIEYNLGNIIASSKMSLSY